MGKWKVEATKRVYLPEELAEDMYIVTPHPKLMPFETMKQLAALKPSESADGDTDGNLDAAQALATSMIVEWNLTDPKSDDGAILPLPSVDSSVWQKIPGQIVLEAVYKAFGEAMEATEPDPNSSAGSANT
ncbi:hypothetical protein [Alicyclobacillus sp. ALC3]|uniref:hypothetical protein n=1 Tax=Alicyclobacillus sp. ALC3 TaxID=2796143 RepID=UPI002378C152|nr:hypothetical protein [Alicyclobacillus sp. ALC3]WDL97798.1 hypothetical protein JC200_03445 [Alicyclobacillus sp. ALC3]